MQRITARLDGVPFNEPSTPKRPTNAQLAAPLTPETVIPAGQRCSQVVRAWFVDQVGASFSFDAEMRAYFADADGTQTMADALARYRATRGLGPKEIPSRREPGGSPRGMAAPSRATCGPAGIANHYRLDHDACPYRNLIVLRGNSTVGRVFRHL